MPGRRVPQHHARLPTGVVTTRASAQATVQQRDRDDRLAGRQIRAVTEYNGPDATAIGRPQRRTAEARQTGVDRRNASGSGTDPSGSASASRVTGLGSATSAAVTDTDFILDTKVRWTHNAALDITSTFGIISTFSSPDAEREYHRFRQVLGRRVAMSNLCMGLVGVLLLVTVAVLPQVPNKERFPLQPTRLSVALYVVIGILLILTAIARGVVTRMFNYASVSKTMFLDLSAACAWTVAVLCVALVDAFSDRPCAAYTPHFATREYVCHRGDTVVHWIFIFLTAKCVYRPKWLLVSFALLIVVRLLGFASKDAASTVDRAFVLAVELASLVVLFGLNVGRDQLERAFFRDILQANAARLDTAAQRSDIVMLVHAAIPAGLIHSLLRNASRENRARAQPLRNGQRPDKSIPVALDSVRVHVDRAAVCVTSPVDFSRLATTQLMHKMVNNLHLLVTTFDAGVKAFGLDEATTYGDQYVVTAGLFRGNLANLTRFAVWQTSTDFEVEMPLHAAIGVGELESGLAGDHSLRYVLHGPALAEALTMLDKVPVGQVWMRRDIAEEINSHLVGFGNSTAMAWQVGAAPTQPMDFVGLSRSGSRGTQSERADDVGRIVAREHGASTTTLLIRPLDDPDETESASHPPGSVTRQVLSRTAHPANASRSTAHFASIAVGGLHLQPSVQNTRALMSQTVALQSIRTNTSTGSTEGNADAAKTFAGLAAFVQSEPPSLTTMGFFKDPEVESKFNEHANKVLARGSPAFFGLVCLFWLLVGLVAGAERYFRDDESYAVRAAYNYIVFIALAIVVVAYATAGLLSKFAMLTRAPTSSGDEERTRPNAGQSFLDVLAFMTDRQKKDHVKGDVGQRRTYASDYANPGTLAASLRDEDDEVPAKGGRHDATAPPKRLPDSAIVPVDLKAAEAPHEAADALVSAWARHAGHLRVFYLVMQCTAIGALFFLHRNVITNSPGFIAIACIPLLCHYLLMNLCWWLAMLAGVLVAVAPIVALSFYQLNVGASEIVLTVFLLGITVWMAYTGPQLARYQFAIKCTADHGIAVVKENERLLQAVLHGIVPGHVFDSAVQTLRNNVTKLDGTLDAMLHRRAGKFVWEPFPEVMVAEFRVHLPGLYQAGALSRPTTARGRPPLSSDDSSESKSQGARRSEIDRIAEINALVESLGGGLLNVTQVLGDAFSVAGPLTARSGDLAKACRRLLWCLEAFTLYLTPLGETFTAAIAVEEGVGAIVGERSLRYRVFGVAAVQAGALIGTAMMNRQASAFAPATRESPGSLGTTVMTPTATASGTSAPICGVAYVTRRFAECAALERLRHEQLDREKLAALAHDGRDDDAAADGADLPAARVTMHDDYHTMESPPELAAGHTGAAPRPWSPGMNQRIDEFLRENSRTTMNPLESLAIAADADVSDRESARRPHGDPAHSSKHAASTSNGSSALQATVVVGTSQRWRIAALGLTRVTPIYVHSPAALLANRGRISPSVLVGALAPKAGDDDARHLVVGKPPTPASAANASGSGAVRTASGSAPPPSARTASVR